MSLPLSQFDALAAQGAGGTGMSFGGQAGRVKRVAIVGAESTGKTWLAEALADYYAEPFVPEYAREYLLERGLDYDYTEADVLTMAKAQMVSEEAIAPKARRLLFCDTNLVVIKVWMDHSYQRTHPWVLHEMRLRHYDLHLVCDIDLPWTPDPLREHPHLRLYFRQVYLRELQDLGVKYKVIQGLERSRLGAAIVAIEELLQQP
jgi:NadR type nicotinamide-nucleotide adenylyltransferase